MMYKYLFTLSLLLLLSGFYGSCFAAQPSNRQLTTDQDGFTTSLQEVERPQLLMRLKLLQQTLWDKQIELQRLLKKRSFKIADAIITLVAPGGLLYAINKQRNYVQTKTNLSLLNRDLVQLQDDLIALDNHFAQLQQGEPSIASSYIQLQLALAE